MFAPLLLVAAVAGVPQQHGAEQTRTSVSAMHELSSAIRPAEVALVGVIERFEQAERRLVLRTHEGHMVTFFLAAGATVRMGSRVLSLSDLGAHKGRKAKVRFTMSGGRRNAHWVVISSDPPKTTA